MSGRIHRSRIPLKPKSQLPSPAQVCLIQLKHRLRTSGTMGLTRFRNQMGNLGTDGPPLPQLSSGCAYYEFQVGQSRDATPNAGRVRFVVEFHATSRTIHEIYYTEQHYQKATFYRIVD